MAGDGRIQALRVRIRASESSPELATQAVALIREVLERALHELDRSERVVLIRKLELAWRVSEIGLDEEAVARLTADLVEALRPPWSEALEPPDPEAQVAVFEDQAAWWADALAARASGTLAWFHARVIPGEREPLELLAARELQPLALAVLRRLGARAEAVLHASPTDSVERLAAALGVRPAAHPDAAAALVRLAGRLADDGAADLRSGLAGAEAPALSRPASRQDIPPTHRDDEVPPAATAATEHAGLFYLASTLLELGAPEHLWTACLPEARVVARAAQALVGDDPAVHWFAGDIVEAPPVTHEQSGEVIDRILEELAIAISRRAPETPPLELHIAGGLLVVTLIGGAFPVWLAPLSADTRRRLSWILEHWPGRVLGDRPLAEAGPAGRIVLAPVAARRLFMIGERGPADWTSTVVLGAAAALFEHRVGAAAAPGPEAFVERWLRVPGLLRRTRDLITVRIPASRVSFPVRRAGLDRDPGYLPWLQCTVRLVFEGDEPDGDDLPRAGDS